MVLLRKAVGAAALGHAGVEAIDEPERQSPPQRWGLLQKCIEVLDSGVAEGAAATSPAEPAERRSAPKRPAEIASLLRAALQSLPEGIEMPSHLFTALKTHLSIEKGALLLYDPLRLVYAPWASCGYDQTTLHKLRIALGANESFNAIANGIPLAISDTGALAAYQGYFSSREFASLSRIVLCPFISQEKLIGVLLVTDIRAPLDTEADLLSCLSAAAEAASPIAAKAREEKLKVAAVPDVRPGATPEEEVERFIASPAAEGKKLLFATLSLAGYAGRIMAAHAHLDAFRLEEDLRYFLGAFVSDLGTAFPLGSGRFLVGLRNFGAGDLDLFLHQLGSFLSMLFGADGGERPSEGPSIEKTRVWPDDGGDIRELLAFLSASQP